MDARTDSAGASQAAWQHELYDRLRRHGVTQFCYVPGGNLGATIAVMNPHNPGAVYNGHYGETGWQKSHTDLGADLETIAAGCGVRRTMTVSRRALQPQGEA